jgi:hypothetical protein
MAAGARSAPNLVMTIAASACLILPVARAAAFEDDRSDPAVFTAYCIDYYTPTECDDALRFIRHIYGYRYIAILGANEDPQAYLATFSPHCASPWREARQ